MQRQAASSPSTRPGSDESDFGQWIDRLESNINQVVLGKPDVVRRCLVALLAGEHLLLEDVPGVGKTLIGKAIAQSVSGKFCRIQFTPDLLPSDIIGTSVYDAQASDFAFHRGPIFSNIVLADEINRTPPRTQSALLEAMSDKQASVDGQTYLLPVPFLVIATQNPFEYEGTYPLPESQLDRFLMRLSIGYPEREEERRVLNSHRTGEPVDELRPVIDTQQVVALQRRARTTTIDASVESYLLDIVEATRQCDELSVGVSPRGTLYLYRGAQALALIEGRNFVVPDDVKQLAVPVLAHRVLPRSALHGGHRKMTETIVASLVQQIAVPS